MQLARILAVGALAGAFAGAQPVQSQDITLEFVVWNYSLETIQDNISSSRRTTRASRSRSPTIPGRTISDSLVLRFRGNTPTDVIYGGQDWLPAWGAAGFIAPLDDSRAGRRASTSSRRTSRASR